MKKKKNDKNFNVHPLTKKKKKRNINNRNFRINNHNSQFTKLKHILYEKI